MYVIETRGLAKRYGGKHVVEDFGMHVPQGEIYGFVGKNGAGKSTVMKMVCGLVTPTAGEVVLFGSAAEEAAARLGALIEAPGLIGNLTAFQNLMSKAIALGVADAKGRCDELLEATGLAQAAHRKAKGFSLGMKQRLGLALALIGSPDVLLLDEPFNGLDPEGTRAMRSLLIDLNRTRGITMVISSHVLDQLDRMATRYGIICEGRMVREVAAADVEAECRDGLRLRTADIARTLALLQGAFPHASFTALPDGALMVTGQADAQAVASSLHAAGHEVLELSIMRRDLETYFIELMEGGASHV